MADKPPSRAMRIRARSRPGLLGRGPTTPTENPELIRTALKQWQRASEAEDAQRKAILAAKQFRAGNQWPDAVKIAREGGNAIQGQPPTPPKPLLTVDRVSQPVRQASNQIKAADFTFDVLPMGGQADTETADVIKGCLRRIHNEARTDSPVEWAADQALEGGIGWFRVRTAYVHDTWTGDLTDPALFDQEVRLERIANNLCVYCDPHAVLPTRSDARYLFVTEDLSRDEFQAKYPHADHVGLQAFYATGDCPKEWVNQDSIRIAEYWRIEEDFREFYWLKDGTIGEGTPPKGAELRMQRTMAVPVVHGSKINAYQELPTAKGEPERWSWAGSRIPLVPILGEELNIDGVTKVRGMIEASMDAQRMVNYGYSAAVDAYALMSKSPWIAEQRSIAQYQKIWQTANIYSHSYLPYDAWSPEGQALPKPERNNTDAGGALTAAVQLMQISEQSIKATTSFFDASLAQLNPNQRSGAAISNLQAQAELATANYPDNVRRALIYAGQLIVEILPKITRPGQVLRILGVDDEPQQVIIGQAFRRNAQGSPVPNPSMTPEQVQQQRAAANGQDLPDLHEFYDLNNGTYAVTVSIGKAHATRKEEGAQALGELIPHLPPEMAAVLMPDYVRLLSFPNAAAIADRLEQALPPQLQPHDQTQGGLPPQVQGIIQNLQLQLQQAQQVIATKQAEKQADFVREVKLQEMKNAATIAVARINAAKAAFDTVAEAQEERLADGIKLAHEQREAAKDRAHDVGLAAQDHMHQTLQNAQAHQQVMEQTAQQGVISSQQQADAAQFQAQNQAQNPNGGGQ